MTFHRYCVGKGGERKNLVVVHRFHLLDASVQRSNHDNSCHKGFTEKIQALEVEETLSTSYSSKKKTSEKFSVKLKKSLVTVAVNSEKSDAIKPKVIS